MGSSFDDRTAAPDYPTHDVNRAASLLRELDAHSAARPSEIGSYRIVELLGEGGMGEVYRAEQQQPVRRTVALKLIKPGMDSRQVLARFESERQMLALMQHPNVAAVFDAGVSETGRPYFVMEYVQGKPITEFCDQQRLTIRQRLELFMQACEAVQHAHQKTIVHRDLKPGNILVTQDRPGAPGLVKVIDFGVAKATGRELGGQTLVTQQGQLLGTPEYMSPEQADLSTRAGDVDTRTDIYSLGVVLYELLIGARPFDADTWRNSSFDQIRQLIREVEPPRPSTRLSSLGAAAAEIAQRRQLHLAALQHELRHELEWIPLKAMRKDRNDRYRTAADLADDVRNHLSHRPLIAGPESRAYRLRKFVRRNRGAVVAVTSVLLAVLGGFVATGAMYLRSERLRTLAEENRTRADRESATARLEAEKQHAVNSFLNTMLAEVNPRRSSSTGRAGVRDLKLVDVLAASAQRLDAGDLKAQPAIEAAVRTTIGFAYLNLGEYDAAEGSMRRALDLNRALYGDEHVEVVTSLNRLASVLRMRGRVAEAEPLHRQVLAMRRKLLGDGHRDVAQSYNELGAVYLDQGKFADAAEILTRALAMDRRFVAAGSSQPDELLSPLRNLANAQSALRRFDEADATLREALDVTRRSFGDQHYEVALVLFQMAVNNHRRGEFAQAETLFRECLAMQRKVLGEQHPMVARSLQFLGALLCNESKYDEALPLLESALAMHRKFLGPENISVAATLNHIGLVRMGLGDLSGAEPLLLEAVEMNRRVVGDDHVEFHRCVRDLIKYYEASGKHDQAKSWRSTTSNK